MYGAKVLRKKFKKNLFAIVFLISFAIRVRWVPVVLLVFRLWCLCSGSGRILYYFADLGKMGRARIHAYTHTRVIIFRRAIFRLCTEIFSTEIFGCLIAIFRLCTEIFSTEILGCPIAIFRRWTEIFSTEIFGCPIAIFRRWTTIFIKK